MDASELDGLSAEELIAKKDSIEAEIKENYDLLETQRGVGMKGALVDSEGFPRSDIDIYAVRKARNRVICLQNDHKAVMREIEGKLHEIHAEARRKRSEGEEEEEEGGARREPPRVFARVNVVSEGSPAALAGLQVGDEICDFGSVTAANFSELQDIATVVQHSQQRPVRVVVRRRGVEVVLSLTPRRWEGRGTLGCNIVAV